MSENRDQQLWDALARARGASLRSGNICMLTIMRVVVDCYERGMEEEFARVALKFQGILASNDDPSKSRILEN